MQSAETENDSTTEKENATLILISPLFIKQPQFHFRLKNLT